MMETLDNPAIMLSHSNKFLIIDAKYYSHTTQTQYDVHTLHSSNLYQIFTYEKTRKPSWQMFRMKSPECCCMQEQMKLCIQTPVIK